MSDCPEQEPLPPYDPFNDDVSRKLTMKIDMKTWKPEEINTPISDEIERGLKEHILRDYYEIRNCGGYRDDEDALRTYIHNLRYSRLHIDKIRYAERVVREHLKAPSPQA